MSGQIDVLSPGLVVLDRLPLRIDRSDVLRWQGYTTALLTPVKTMSFLVGLGPQAGVDHSFTQRRRGWMRDCLYRRAPGEGARISWMWRGR